MHQTTSKTTHLTTSLAFKGFMEPVQAACVQRCASCLDGKLEWNVSVLFRWILVALAL